MYAIRSVFYMESVDHSFAMRFALPPPLLVVYSLTELAFPLIFLAVLRSIPWQKYPATQKCAFNDVPLFIFG